MQGDNFSENIYLWGNSEAISSILTGARANNRPDFLSQGPSCFWRSRVMPLTLRVHILSSLAHVYSVFRVLLEDSRFMQRPSFLPAAMALTPANLELLLPLTSGVASTISRGGDCE